MARTKLTSRQRGNVRFKEQLSKSVNYRVNAIVTTELESVNRALAAEIMPKAGISQWIWQDDGDPCPEICAPLVGAVFGWDQNIDYMSHPNCRCQMVPFEGNVEEEY